jgi:hypothetical protein
MGYSRFSSSDYSSYSDTHKLKSARREEVFTSRGIPAALDPSKIVIRESRDSDINPKSTPIIIGLDVTGSMGFVAEAIAKEQLPALMGSIYEELPVTDPHVMFMGIGDVYSDSAPLQASQFEAGAIPLIEQLRSMWLEGGGGGNNTESYNLPWYFAAHKTSTDSFEKRGKKGYLFTIGDEMPPEDLDESGLRKTFGRGQHVSAGSTHELLAEAQKKFSVFHIIAEEGNYCRSRLNPVRAQWSELLGANAIFMRNHRHLSAIVTATLKIANGADINEVIAESDIPKELEYAFSNALQVA